MYAERKFRKDECLPWDVIDTGVSGEYLLAERAKAERGEFTADCAADGCRGCGVCVGMKSQIQPAMKAGCPAGWRDKSQN